MQKIIGLIYSMISMDHNNNKESLRGGAFKEKRDFFEKKGLRYGLPIMIPYLHEKYKKFVGAVF